MTVTFTKQQSGHYQPKNFPLPANHIYKAEGEDIPPYIFSDTIAIAVDVALVTDRPLLVSGPPGCGKTRLAQAVAALLGWNFLAKTITSRTRLEELTVEVDHLARLNDAQRAAATHEALKPDEAYYRPGIFWWAFNGEEKASGKAVSLGSGKGFPGTLRKQKYDARHGVLLLDEIDKAEPDLPNDLLEPLETRSFGLPDGRTQKAIPGQRLLTIITTNRERELPQAFIRRCVSLFVEHPDAAGLERIARERYPKADSARICAIAARITRHREEMAQAGLRPPGTSEFLDAVQACEELQVSVPGPDVQGSSDEFSLWTQIENAVLLKPQDGRNT